MKTLLLLLSLSAVGFGQATATSKAPECRLATCNSYYPGNECLSNQTPCPKPTKKPHKSKPSVRTSVGDLDTGPAEMLKPDGCDVAAGECWAVHKNAIPTTWDGISGRGYNEGLPAMEQWLETPLMVHVATSPTASQIDSAAGSVVKLSDSEYSHLQQLRASVVEEEKRLAVKYGATPGYDPCEFHQNPCFPAKPRLGDHYEFHGQFLIIDKGGK